MKKLWLAWWVVTVLFAVYALFGFIASAETTTDIILRRGYPIRFTVVRLAQDSLRLSLTFRGEHTQRPELGIWSARDDWRDSGLLRFPQPGASIRFTASTPDAEAIYFEPMPASARSVGMVWRDLSANLPVEPGVWRWPPPADTPKIMLPAGFTTVTMEIIAVDPALVGEKVLLTVVPPLSFKSCMPSVCWLWAWMLWPLVACVLALVAIILFAIQWRRAHKRREKQA